MFRNIKNNKAYTLIEIIIVMSLSGILVGASVLSLFTFRNNFIYDSLLNQIVESVNYSKTKAVASVLDESENRIKHGVKIFEDRIVEFQGEEYTEGADKNVEYDVPFGLRLSSECSPQDNGEVSFSPITGENGNTCTINIYKFEDVKSIGTVLVSKYGVEQAN